MAQQLLPHLLPWPLLLLLLLLRRRRMLGLVLLLCWAEDI
jgi:uncharacterized protein (TIGR03382 family)